MSKDPHFPHPVPDAVQVRVNFANSRQNVGGRDMTGLPNLATLRGNILTWLQSYLPGATFARDFDPAAPGKVLITGHGVEHGRSPSGTTESAKVLNGDVPEATYRVPHNTWLTTQKRKYERNAKVQGLAGGLDEAANRIWTFEGGLLACARVVKEPGDTSGYTDKDNQVIWINAHCDDGSMLVHEFFHAVEGGGHAQTDFGWAFDEGAVDFFARDVSVAYGYSYKGNIGYEAGYRAVKDIVDRIGLPVVLKLWFERPASMLGVLGPIANKIAEKRPVRDDSNYDDVGDLVTQFCNEATRLEPLLIVTKPVVVANPAPKKWPTVPPPNKPFRSSGGAGW